MNFSMYRHFEWQKVELLTLMNFLSLVLAYQFNRKILSLETDLSRNYLTIDTDSTSYSVANSMNSFIRVGCNFKITVQKMYSPNRKTLSPNSLVLKIMVEN